MLFWYCISDGGMAFSSFSFHLHFVSWEATIWRFLVCLLFALSSYPVLVPMFLSSTFWYFISSTLGFSLLFLSILIAFARSIDTHLSMIHFILFLPFYSSSILLLRHLFSFLPPTFILLPSVVKASLMQNLKTSLWYFLLPSLNTYHLFIAKCLSLFGYILDERRWCSSRLAHLYAALRSVDLGCCMLCDHLLLSYPLFLHPLCFLYLGVALALPSWAPPDSASTRIYPSLSCDERKTMMFHFSHNFFLVVIASTAASSAGLYIQYTFRCLVFKCSCDFLFAFPCFLGRNTFVLFWTIFVSSVVETWLSEVGDEMYNHWEGREWYDKM